MIAPDILLAIITFFFLLIYGPAMTSIFFYERWKFKNLKLFEMVVSSSTVFIFSFLLLLAGHFVFKQAFEVWLVIYALTITILVIGEKATKRKSV
ncbi:MAG: hypothetical protein ABI723_14945 [Bacteroidia bacterium]